MAERRTGGAADPHLSLAPDARRGPAGGLDRIIDFGFRLLEILLVVLLAGMVVMVFGNVVLRYAFNSGLNVSEEMSRYFFVWLIFLGAVVAFREHGHLGVDTLVLMLPPAGRVVCEVVSDLLILACCAILAWGTWVQAAVNASAVSPVTQMPMIWVNGVGLFTGGAIAVMTLARLARTFMGRRDPLPGEGLSEEERSAEVARAARSGRLAE